jgi:single-strand DNA-binding protein
MNNINRVVISGNLTRDPELKALPSGTSICELRVACNGSRKDSTSGEWVPKANYFDVKVFGGQGESVARYLTRGRGVVIDGRIDWREWETDSGAKRQAVSIIADNIQFLPDGKSAEERNGAEPEPAGVAGGQGDDIPF